MSRNPTIVTGVVSFDLSGAYSLHTFTGRYRIPESVLERAASLIEAQTEPYVAATEIAGVLARGEAVDGELLNISYLIRGQELPAGVAPTKPRLMAEEELLENFASYIQTAVDYARYASEALKAIDRLNGTGTSDPMLKAAKEMEDYHVKEQGNEVYERHKDMYSQGETQGALDALKGLRRLAEAGIKPGQRYVDGEWITPTKQGTTP